MAAGGIDAFAPPVGEPHRPAGSQEVDEPGREVAAGQVAVARRRHPARHQPERRRVLPPDGNALDRVLHVQEAEIVLAALAQHRLLCLPRRVDRTSVVSGKSVSVRVALGGRRIIKKKTKYKEIESLFEYNT